MSLGPVGRPETDPSWRPGAAPALGRLEDFDASTMPPSAALTARDLRFVDGNVQQDLRLGCLGGSQRSQLRGPRRWDWVVGLVVV